MTYLVISAAYFIFFGWQPFMLSLDLMNDDVSWGTCLYVEEDNDSHLYT